MPPRSCGGDCAVCNEPLASCRRASERSRSLGSLFRGLSLCVGPGKRFSDYGSEQIAQQVQDSWFPPGGVAPRTNGAIVWHMRTAPPGKLDPANIRSLSRDKGYEYRDTPK